MGFLDSLLPNKKSCSICGKETGRVFGNNKLADGNMCNDCEAKLSPWFTGRKSATVAQINEQLAYREQNRAAASGFGITHTFGNGTKKLLIDGNRGQFTVTGSKSLASANPDILNFS